MNLPVDKKIVLFDGVCNFCNASVRFIVKRDKKDLYRFASLQSDLGKKMTVERGIDSSKVDSIILIEPGHAYYIKSTAALEICKDLNGLYPALSLFLFIPESFRNLVYDYIAKNRYQWFGKTETCPMPSKEEQSRFLDT
jgi:predicted DCC family thiol-disulfide oxidoreductase YuxK